MPKAVWRISSCKITSQSACSGNPNITRDASHEAHKVPMHTLTILAASPQAWKRGTYNQMLKERGLALVRDWMTQLHGERC